MSLSRYTINRGDFPAAIKFMQGKAFKKDTPNWAVRNRQYLQVVNGKLRYNDRVIIADEEIDSYLRNLVFGKKSKSPLETGCLNSFNPKTLPAFRDEKSQTS